eukprot:3760703-Amphidinium_carterae.1
MDLRHLQTHAYFRFLSNCPAPVQSEKVVLFVLGGLEQQSLGWISVSRSTAKLFKEAQDKLPKIMRGTVNSVFVNALLEALNHTPMQVGARWKRALVLGQTQSVVM